MAVLDRGDVPAGQAAPKGKGFSSIVNMFGAAMSLALIAGLGVWGYKLVIRDVSGVPVVRALEGPMRTAPENPGGQLADHQGLSVNRVQAEGEAEPTADRLVLAPGPVDVIDADQPGLGTRPQPRAEATPVAEAADADMAEPEVTVATRLTNDLPEDVTATPAPATDPVAEALALATQIADGVDPLSDLDAPAETAPVQTGLAAAEAEAAPEIVAADVPGVRSSPRPTARPANLEALRSAAAPTNVATVAATPDLDVDPSTIVPGTRLVQLGAFDSAEVARAEWDKLYGRFTQYLEDKSRVVQKAESGGRVFYRLRAMGFDDLNDARRFCSALLAEGAACIPVQVR